MRSRHLALAVLGWCGLSLGPGPAPAADPRPATADDPFIRAFTDQQQATTSYQADLDQTLQLRGLREPVESRGRLYFQSPGRLALVFDEPPGEYLIVNEQGIYLKKSRRPLRHERLPSSTRRGDHDLLFLLDLLEHGATNTLERFTAELVKSNGEMIVTLVPHRREPRSREPVRIENHIRIDDHELHQVRVEFENRHAIIYRFRNPQRDTAIDPSIFQPRDEVR